MKSIPNQTGLYRTHCSYYFRKKIPLDLREILDSRECKKAFPQRDYLSAKRTTALLNAALDQLFAMIRLMQPTSDDVKFLIRTYFEKLLIDAEGLLWLDSEVWRGYESENHDGATPDERIRQRQEDLAHIQKTAKMQGQHDLFRDLAKQLMEWKGYRFEYFEKIDKEIPAYQSVGRSDHPSKIDRYGKKYSWINESASGVNPDKLWTTLRRFINGTEAIYGG